MRVPHARRRATIVQDRLVYGLNWGWIALMATAPPVAAVAVAWVVWRDGQIILGNLAGTAVIFMSAFAVIMRERIELDRFQLACIDAGLYCVIEPAPFTRFAIYASVGLLEIFALFAFSLRVEQKQRNRRYAPEWRR